VSSTRRKRLVACAALVAIAAVAGCSGEAASDSNPGAASAAPSAPASVSAASPAPNPTPQVETAVKAYSAAFLGGQAKDAWLMRMPEAREKDSYAMFVTAVNAAREIYGDAIMTSLVVTVNGDTARATYRYDIGEIDQKNQRWVLRDGKWLVDN